MNSTNVNQAAAGLRNVIKQTSRPMTNEARDMLIFRTAETLCVTAQLVADLWDSKPGTGASSTASSAVPTATTKPSSASSMVTGGGAAPAGKSAPATSKKGG